MKSNEYKAEFDKIICPERLKADTKNMIRTKSWPSNSKQGVYTKRLITIAVSLVIILGISYWNFPKNNNIINQENVLTESDNQKEIIVSEVNLENENVAMNEDVYLLEDEIYVNKITSEVGNPARLYFDEDVTERIEWNYTEVVEYLDYDIYEIEWPEGIRIGEAQDKYTVIVDDNEQVIYDNFMFMLENKVNSSVRTIVTIEIFKKEKINDAPIVADEELKMSIINGTSILVGAKAIKNSDDYWYVASFAIDELNYYLYSNSISEEMFIEVIESLLYE
jgi:hypothetical protein